MTTYELIQHLDACNLLRPMIKSGVMSLSVIYKRDIFQYYQKEIAIGKDKTTAITHTAEANDVSENYVYKIIKQMSCASEY